MFRAFAASFRWVPWSVIVAIAMVGVVAAQDAKDEKADRFAAPETDDPQVLVDFIKKMMEFEPKSREEAKLYNEKSPAAVKQAADRILELDKDGKSEAAKFAQRVLMQMRIMMLRDSKPDVQEKLFNDLKAYLSSREKLERADLGMAVRLADALEALESPTAPEAFETFGELLAKNESEPVAERGKFMLGVARRLRLVGNPMELIGKTVQGKPFDLHDWKGKVVLVDFWATWCGPCVAEMPHVKELYEKYHDKGFEVVGVNLDEDRAKLDEFLKENELPWTILHHDEDHGEHPAATRYSIVTIPFMSLIDRDGKVISIQAYGEELTKLLDKQFAENN